MIGNPAKKSSNAWKFVYPAASAGWVVLALASPETGKSLLREDGFIQWCQFGFLLAAAILGAIHFLRTRQIVWLLVAAFAFGVAMEEISWGQRIFNWHTPAWWARNNIQDETTVHNLAGLQRVRHWGLILFAMAGWRWLPRSHRPSLLVILLAGLGREAMELAYAMNAAPDVFTARFWAGRFCEWNETGVAVLLFVRSLNRQGAR